MTKVLDANVTTRRGDTGAEDLQVRLERVAPDIWENFQVAQCGTFVAGSFRSSTAVRPVSKDKQRWTLHLASESGSSDPHSLHESVIQVPEITVIRVGNSVPKPPEFSSLLSAARTFKLFSESLEVLSLPSLWSEAFTRATRETSTLVSSLSTLRQLLASELVNEEWTDAQNERRCDLIDKEIAGTLSPGETKELARLQDAMLAYRRRVAPLPIDDLRNLQRDLLKKLRSQKG